VIRSVATSKGSCAAFTSCGVAMASPERTSSTIYSIVKPCASITTSVHPFCGHWAISPEPLDCMYVCVEGEMGPIARGYFTSMEQLPVLGLFVQGAENASNLCYGVKAAIS
jgi:hypothetical protein